MERYHFVSDNCLILSEGVEALDLEFMEGFDDPSHLQKIQKLVIPSTLTQIDCSVWDKFTGLQEISVCLQNAHFISVAGVLYTKDQKALVKYPAGKQDAYFEIPPKVATICRNAFLHATYLNTVKVGCGVSTIEEMAFFNALGLRHIYISNHVTNIRGPYIFGVCDEQQIFLCEWCLVVGGETGSEIEKWCAQYGVNFYPMNEKEIGDFLALPLPDLHPYNGENDSYLSASRKTAREKSIEPDPEAERLFGNLPF